MPNAITMLKSDHATVRRLLRELNGATAPKQRERLAATLEREIKIHSQIEEEVFYPAFKAAAEDTKNEDLVYEAAEEHHVVDIELPSLCAANPKSHEFEAKAKVLKDLIEHHIKEEEGQMFIAARRLFSDQQLRELGDLMAARRKSAEAMWASPLLQPVKRLQGIAHKMLPTKVKTAKATAIAKAMEAVEERR
jgi:hemerythrin-like domain-containing protein